MAVKIQSLERVNVKGFDLELVEYCLEMILEKSKQSKIEEGGGGSSS